MVRAIRKRYLLFQTYPESSKFRRGEIHRAVQNSLLHLFGAYGLSQVNLSLLAHDEEGCFGVLRCSHKHVEVVKAALTCIAEIEGKPATFRVIRTSGTLKSLREELRGRSRGRLDKRGCL